ncbi:uncharacterized protein LOC135279841 [Passer domesticus]|uniref:uncharacterized protein LOC135279841 n=1 Tax=Passer domesticus TaxID=48849 RepID=UPI0030FE2C5C
MQHMCGISWLQYSSLHGKIFQCQKSENMMGLTEIRTEGSSFSVAPIPAQGHLRHTQELSINLKKCFYDNVAASGGERSRSQLDWLTLPVTRGRLKGLSQLQMSQCISLCRTEPGTRSDPKTASALELTGMYVCKKVSSLFLLRQGVCNRRKTCRCQSLRKFSRFPITQMGAAPCAAPSLVLWGLAGVYQLNNCTSSCLEAPKKDTMIQRALMKAR